MKPQNLFYNLQKVEGLVKIHKMKWWKIVNHKNLNLSIFIFSNKIQTSTLYLNWNWQSYLKFSNTIAILSWIRQEHLVHNLYSKNNQLKFNSTCEYLNYYTTFVDEDKVFYEFEMWLRDESSPPIEHTILTKLS